MAARFIGFNPLAGFIVAIVFVLVAVFSTLPVRADFRILSSSGGEVSSYLAVFARVRQSGDRVIIDGPCLSACTLVLSTIPKNRICVTRRAVLGFHAPKYVDPRSGRMSRSSEATRIVTQSYPAGVRAWIKKRGGLTQKVIYLRGRSCCSLSALLSNLPSFKSSRGTDVKWCQPRLRVRVKHLAGTKMLRHATVRGFKS